MKANQATLVILGLLALSAAALYDRNRTREIRTMLDALDQDREALNRQVKNLTRLAAESSRQSRVRS